MFSSALKVLAFALVSCNGQSVDVDPIISVRPIQQAVPLLAADAYSLPNYDTTKLTADDACGILPVVDPTGKFLLKGRVNNVCDKTECHLDYSQVRVVRARPGKQPVEYQLAFIGPDRNESFKFDNFIKSSPELGRYVKVSQEGMFAVTKDPTLSDGHVTVLKMSIEVTVSFPPPRIKITIKF